MEPIDIGLWVSGGLLVVVLLGMRVAFAAGLAGFVGLVWIFWDKMKYAPEKFLYFNERRDTWDGALGKAFQIAGQVPHSKVSAQVLSLIPVFIMIGYMAYHARLTSALFEAAKRWLAWVPGGLAVSTVFATAGFAAVSGA
ncbi:MAG: TRAP transporter large permease subunit, partial [Lutimaribacter sp.]